MNDLLRKETGAGLRADGWRTRRCVVALVASAAILTGTTTSAAALAGEEDPTGSQVVETSSATTDDTTGAPSEAPENVESVLAEGLDVRVDTSGETAVKAVTEGGTMKVPTDPADGIKMDPAGGPAVDIGLPAAAKADDAEKLGTGAVAFEGAKVDNQIVATDTGGTVMVKIKDVSAPERYRYPLDLAEGQTITPTDVGGFVVTNADNSVALTIDAPWALSAQNEEVPVSYELDGTTITMVVRHHDADYGYPIQADPKIVWGWWGTTIYLSRNETKNAINVGLWIAGGPFIAAGKAAAAVFWIAGAPGVNLGERVVKAGWCIGITRLRWMPHVNLTWPYRC